MCTYETLRVIKETGWDMLFNKQTSDNFWKVISGMLFIYFGRIKDIKFN